MSALCYTLAVLLSCRAARRMMAITKSLLMSAGPAVCLHSLGISNERRQQVPPVSIPSETTATLPASRCQSCVEVCTLHCLQQEFTSLKPRNTGWNLQAECVAPPFFSLLNQRLVFVCLWTIVNCGKERKKRKLTRQQTFERLCRTRGEAQLKHFQPVFQSAPDNMTHLIFVDITARAGLVSRDWTPCNAPGSLGFSEPRRIALRLPAGTNGTKMSADALCLLHAKGESISVAVCAWVYLKSLVKSHLRARGVTPDGGGGG